MRATTNEDERTVLVTGGTGFIARWCIVELLRRGYDVRTTVRDAAAKESVRRDGGGHRGRPRRSARVRRRRPHRRRRLGRRRRRVRASSCTSRRRSAVTTRATRTTLIVPARDGALRVLARRHGGRRRAGRDDLGGQRRQPDVVHGGQRHRRDAVDRPRRPRPARLPPIEDDRREGGMGRSWRRHGSTTLTTVLPGAVFGPILSTDNLGSVEVIARMLTRRDARHAEDRPRGRRRPRPRRPAPPGHDSPAAAGERFLGTGEFMWMGDIAAVRCEHLGDDAEQGADQRDPRRHRRPLIRCCGRWWRRGTPGGSGRRRRVGGSWPPR